VSGFWCQWNLKPKNLKPGTFNTDLLSSAGRQRGLPMNTTRKDPQGRQSEDALAERAWGEFREHKYEAAERDFGEVTKRDPSNVYAQLLLGQCLFAQQKYVNASTTATQGIRVGTSTKLASRKGYLDMVRTVEAIVDEHGRVRLLEDVTLPEARRALVTILEDAPKTSVSETALVSEPALAKDWNRPEEDEAWSHLQSGR
jgi:hypothetical protein